jgi:hypothetical protein
MVTIYLWWGCKGGIFFLVLANPIGYAKTICFSKWLQLMSFVHDLVARNHVGIYVHVATSVFMLQFMGLLDSTQGQTWSNKNINESTFVGLEKCEGGLILYL